MKKLKFSPHLCRLIIDEEKTTTWRYNDDKELHVDDEIEFLNAENLRQIGIGTITSINQTTFGSLSDEDWDGHEKFESEAVMYDTYRRYYPDENIGSHSAIKVIKFRFTPVEK